MVLKLTVFKNIKTQQASTDDKLVLIQHFMKN